VLPSQTNLTKAGRDVLARDPENPGSLGIAISEAVEEAVSVPGTKYALDSVLNHVLLHQTVIGLEVKKQFEDIGEYPDMMFAPYGGGCNFAGATFPFLGDARRAMRARRKSASSREGSGQPHLPGCRWLQPDCALPGQ
jgi:predicted alternative tryptophan synthase beta-subunit